MQEKTINELIDRLRKGKLNEVVISHKKNKIKIKRQDSDISDKIKEIKIKLPKLKKIDFSGLDVSHSDFTGIDLEESSFSGARVIDTNFSYSNLKGALFYDSRISQSDFSNSSYFNPKRSYMTGSVNLYNIQQEYSTAPTGYSPPTNSSADYQADSGKGADWGVDYGNHETINNPIRKKKKRSYR